MLQSMTMNIIMHVCYYNIVCTTAIDPLRTYLVLLQQPERVNAKVLSRTLTHSGHQRRSAVT